uniref:Uncharacterized protein n=1 Tax=Anguilla anguilla TaxID=7936 RepID=A0A0E9QDM0_ANGAN
MHGVLLMDPRAVHSEEESILVFAFIFQNTRTAKNKRLPRRKGFETQPLLWKTSDGDMVVAGEEGPFIQTPDASSKF